MPRSSRCRDCGRLFDVYTTTGALPNRCPACRSAAPKPQRKPQSAYQTRIRQIAALTTRVKELEALIERTGGKRRYVKDPGRRTLTRCVRRVAYAEGREGTVAALLDLRDAAEAWAAMLAAREPADDDPSEAPEVDPLALEAPEPEPTVVHTGLGDVRVAA